MKRSQKYQSKLKRTISNEFFEVSSMKKYRSLKDARALMEHLDYEEEIQALKRRWLMRRWPENLHSSIATSKTPRECGFLVEGCIPESLLRDDNSARIVKTTIQRSFDAFDEKYKDDHCFQHCQLEQSDLQPEKLQCLSDRELFGSLPVLLKSLKLKSLRTLVNVMTGRPYRGPRMRMIRKIQKVLSMLFVQTGEDASKSLQKIQHILRNPDNMSQIYTAPLLTEMPPSCLAAAKSTLEQLEKFPIRTLIAMRRKMTRKSHAINSKPFSANRNALAEKVKKRGEDLLLHVREGDPLPAPLNKAMLVASLSARQICGQDGGLLQHLGPISPETEALHHDFLKAISHVQKLQCNEVKDVYNCLSSDNRFSSKNLRILRNKIQSILIDWLFESSDATIPEPIMRSVTMINKQCGGNIRAAKKITRSSYKIEERVEAEFECVLNISSHLQQIIRDWAECTGLEQGLNEVYLDESDEDVEPWFSENSRSSPALSGHEEGYVGESTWEPEEVQSYESGPRENQGNSLDCLNNKGALVGQISDISCKDHIKLVKTNGCHANKNEQGENLEEQIQRICDEAGLFAHHLLGCLMDESLSRQGDALETTTKAYLRNGVPAGADGTGERKHYNHQEVMDTSFLLNVAGKLLPQTAGSVIENVKLSLGVI